MNIIIHEKGNKGERDRARGLQKYLQTCKFFRAKPLDELALSKLSNLQLYRLGEDLYNRQSHRAKGRYTSHLLRLEAATKKKNDPLSYRNYKANLLQIYRARGWRRWWIHVIAAPFGYSGFLKRSKARAAKQGVDVRTGFSFEETKKAADKLMSFGNGAKPSV